MLEPLAPTSRAATILGDGGPSALEVAYKRKGIETEIGKNIAKAEAAKAKAKAADDKNKLEQQKQLDLLPATAAIEHGNYFANVYNEASNKIADILARNGGVIPVEGPDGAEYRRVAQSLKQVKSDSDQLNTDMIRQLALVQAHPGDYLPGTEQRIIDTFGDNKWLQNRQLPPNLLEDNFDVNGYLAPLFEKIKADQTAYGNTTAEGGTEEGTTKFILRDDIKSVAELGAANERANPALRRQYEKLHPETQAKVLKLAKDNKITVEAATALELGIGLVEHVEKTRNVTAPSAAGYGRADEEAGLAWFTQLGIGALTGEYEGKKNLTLPSNEIVVNGKPIPGALFGKTVLQPDGTKIIPAYKDMVWSSKKETVTYNTPNGDVEKTIERVKDVKKYVVDDKAKEVRVSIGNVGSDKVTETKVVPFEHVESEIIAPLAENNKLRIREKGAFDRTNQRVYGLDPNDSRGNNYVLPSDGAGKKKTKAELLRETMQ